MNIKLIENLKKLTNLQIDLIVERSTFSAPHNQSVVDFSTLKFMKVNKTSYAIKGNYYLLHEFNDEIEV